MVILKTKSQVRSFVKRQTQFHKKYTAYTDYFDDAGNGTGVKTEVFIDRNRVILRELHWISGDRGHYKCHVLAKIRLKKSFG